MFWNSVHSQLFVNNKYHSLGLKCWDEIPIDVVEDGGCDLMPKVEGLCSTRGPDSLSIIEQGGNMYVIAADEGKDVSYGDFDEKVKSGKLFKGDELKMEGATVDPKIFDPNDKFAGQSRFFNDDACDSELENALEWCSDRLRMTLGSSMVDYSDPTAPHIHSMIAIGGRGVSIYKLETDVISFVWDSADQFEREGCAAYPWSHNSQQDEEYAPLYGKLYNSTSDEKLKEEIYDRNALGEDGWLVTLG
jgi:hypothetical protein